MAELETLINRYDRQELIQGWDQSKLTGCKAAIVGSDLMANFVATTAASLGFGSIEIFGKGRITKEHLSQYRHKEEHDYSEGFLYFEATEGDTKTSSIASIAKKMNSLVDIDGYCIDTTTKKNLDVMASPDIIFECTNDMASKIAVLEYAYERDIPVISLSASENTGKIGVYDPRKEFDDDQRRLYENLMFQEFDGQKQGPIVSQSISALAVDEARKYVMPIGNDEMLSDIVIHNLESSERFDDNHDIELKRSSLKDKTIIQIGAGALGNQTALGFILAGVGKLCIVDDDDIEETNLNRQLWFYDDVGKLKAEALCVKLARINPDVQLKPVLKRIGPDDEQAFAESDVDLIVETVDNNKTRALLNHFATKYKIPLMSGGTSPSSGQAMIYVPGKSACLDCQVNMDKMALDSYQPHSCIHAAEPSVITSNQVIGAFMLGETRTILDPASYGEPIHKVAKYVAGEDLRVKLLATEYTCSCHEDKEKVEGWMEKMGHLYKNEGGDKRWHRVNLVEGLRISSGV